MSQAVTLQEGGKVLNLKIQSNWVQSAFQANGFGTSDYRTGGNLLRVRWKVKYKARQNNASETFKQGDSFQAYYNGNFATSKKPSEYQTYFYPQNQGAMSPVQSIKFTPQAASSAPTDALSAPYWAWPTGSDGLISDFSVIELIPLNLSLIHI